MKINNQSPELKHRAQLLYGINLMPIAQPEGPPQTGGILYVDELGNLKFYSSNGVIITIASNNYVNTNIIREI